MVCAVVIILIESKLLCIIEIHEKGEILNEYTNNDKQNCKKNPSNLVTAHIVHTMYRI